VKKMELEDIFNFRKYRRELIAAGLSAIGVGVMHYLGHMYIAPKWFPTADPVIVVGATVVLSTFLIAYIGMIKR
jgi:hypothetical protein